MRKAGGAGEAQHSVAVAVRLRPCVDASPSAVLVAPSTGSVNVAGRSFHFASSVVQGSDQVVAYEALAAPLVESLLSGFSCTLMAYGQTGSGKTHTMFGPPGCLTEASLAEAGNSTPVEWGLFPRTVLELLQSGAGTLHATAVEVYQDKAFDLLADRAPLTVGSARKGVVVGASAGKPLIIGNKDAVSVAGAHPPGCRCGPCWKANKEALSARLAKRDGTRQDTRRAGRVAMTAGAASRGAEQFATVGETVATLKTPSDVARLARTVEVTRVATGHALNARSSRSHCLVHLYLIAKIGGQVSKRQLLFVDLAGSERTARTGVEGAAKQQATAINGSLTVLGKVIRALGQHAAHVPYRDSTLTMLLRSSFGGRSKTAVVINAACEGQHLEETVCSLQFGQRVALVKTDATVVVGNDETAERSAMAAELATVRLQLTDMERRGLAGRFGQDVAPSEARSFDQNRARLALEERKIHDSRSNLSELKAKGAPASALRAAEGKVTAAVAEAENYRGILMRQQSIKGFWIEATPSYVQKAQQAKALEARLAMVS